MGKKRNLAVGKVEVPKEYFLRMAKHDYTQYRRALAREFYQNSVDAGATIIRVTTNEKDRSITVKDDGSGMSMDILKHKLLVLGGSEKRSGSTGAFGKAKELLFFSWEKYEIHTGDLLCKGAGGHYTINKTIPRKGTRCTIWIPEEEDFDYFPSEFENVAKKFEVSTKIVVDNREIETKLTRGQLVRETDWCEVYIDTERTRSWYINVRINGQWMYEKYTGNDVGRIIVELKRGSTEMLTSNRDGIKSEFCTQYDDLMNEIIVEREEFIRPKPKMKKVLIKGKGRVGVNFDRIKNKINANIVNKVYDGCNVVGDVLNIKDLFVDAAEMDAVRLLQAQKYAQLKRDKVLYDVEKNIAFIGYDPDFVLNYNDDQRVEVNRFMRTRKASILAECWTEVLKQVLIDIDWAGEFTAGFVIGSESRAEYEKIEGAPYFTLNPHTLSSDLPEIKSVFHNRTMLRKIIIQSACHEISHMYEKYHDRYFVLRFHWVEAQTWKSEEIYKKIITRAFKNN